MKPTYCDTCGARYTQVRECVECGVEIANACNCIELCDDCAAIEDDDDIPACFGTHQYVDIG